MFVSYDYKCKTCNIVVERFVSKLMKDTQKCKECGNNLKRLPAGPRTTFKFNDGDN